jgi:hypothetical protein
MQSARESRGLEVHAHLGLQWEGSGLDGIAWRILVDETK